MKIENGYNKYLQNIQQSKKATVSKQAVNGSEKPAEKNVEVNISKEAKRLSEVSQQAARSERIEQIKAAVNNGTYEIDTEKIAEGIMREIGRQKGIEA
ncbi:MAG TPA: flagellar biosynthesis anti-sigma factor FlgM [Atopostipes sp.]|nr:flagellar biosynthesis anti-sigma factor FlgM [Atopostipes sp.]